MGIAERNPYTHGIKVEMGSLFQVRVWCFCDTSKSHSFENLRGNEYNGNSTALIFKMESLLKITMLAPIQGVRTQKELIVVPV